MQIKIEILEKARWGQDYNHRVRLTGDPTSAEWASTVRDGRDPWCEITVDMRDGYVGSFGGEVWPSAWPELFNCSAPTIYSGCGNTYLTDLGRNLIQEALDG